MGPEGSYTWPWSVQSARPSANSKLSSFFCDSPAGAIRHYFGILRRFFGILCLSAQFTIAPADPAPTSAWLLTSMSHKRPIHIRFCGSHFLIPEGRCRFCTLRTELTAFPHCGRRPGTHCRLGGNPEGKMIPIAHLPNLRLTSRYIARLTANCYSQILMNGKAKSAKQYGFNQTTWSTWIDLKQPQVLVRQWAILGSQPRKAGTFARQRLDGSSLAHAIKVSMGPLLLVNK